MGVSPQTDLGYNRANASAAVSKPNTTFVDDAWLAQRVSMSVATIRAQRFKRRHGIRHWLDIDPVLIGSKPRWRLSDAEAWLEKRTARPQVLDTGEVVA